MDAETALNMTESQQAAARLTHLFMREYGINNGDRMYRDILAAILAGERRGTAEANPLPR